MDSRDGYINQYSHPERVIDGAEEQQGVLVQGSLEQFIISLPRGYCRLTPGTYQYNFPYIDGAVTCTFELDHELIYLGHFSHEEKGHEQSPILQALLHVDNAKRFFPSGSHKIELEDDFGVVQQYYFSTSCALSVNIDRYGVLGCRIYSMNDEAKVGEGAFAKVYDVYGSCKHVVGRDNVALFSEGEHTRVVKIIQRKQGFTGDFKRSVKRAYRNAKLTTHLHPRQPTFGLTARGEQVASYELRKIHGDSLAEYIYKDFAAMEYPEMSFLSLDDRFQISIALFRALITQIHSVGLIHRDIKPENIIIERTATGWIVNIVDVDLAIEIGDESFHAGGSAAYSDRYVFDAKNSVASDVFAIALVVGQVWRYLEQLKIVNLLASSKIADERKRSDWKVEFDLFHGLDDLTQDVREKIVTCLSRCADDDLAKRISAHECVIIFERIYQDFKYETNRISPACRAEAENALKLGVRARELLAHYKIYKVDLAVMKKMNAALIEIIDALPASPLAIREFLMALDVKILRECESREEIIDALQQYLCGYFELHVSLLVYYQKLGELKESDRRSSGSPRLFCMTEVDQYRLQLHKFIKRMLKTPIDIDRLAEECSHMQNKINKIRTKLEEFKDRRGQFVDADQEKMSAAFTARK